MRVAFSSVVFCLDFDPSFSSLVPLRSVFPLFIYLFNPEKVDDMLQVTTSVV